MIHATMATSTTPPDGRLTHSQQHLDYTVIAQQATSSSPSQAVTYIDSIAGLPTHRLRKMEEKRALYREVRSNGSIPETLLEFEVSDFDRARTDPTFKLQGTKVPNPEYRAKVNRDWEIDCNIGESSADGNIGLMILSMSTARLGQTLGISSSYNNRTGQWTATPSVAPPTQVPQASNYTGYEQAATSDIATSSQSAPHCSVWANTVPQTLAELPAKGEDWDQMPLMRHFPEIPENIELLVLKISKLPRSITTQMPHRNLLKNSPFWPHFNLQNGVLLQSSPLFQWYGDIRLFPKETWDFLVNPSIRTK